MLAYEVKRLPDLTLSKYQVFADSGIEGMLDAQTQFLRQLHRVSLLGGVGIHLLYDYDPTRVAGHKLRVFLMFSGVDESSPYASKVERVVSASGVSSYFSLERVAAQEVPDHRYRCSAAQRKHERFLQTVVDSRESYFYLVPNWELRDEARLNSMVRLMESFDERCCYRVDLATEPGLDESVHLSFERPLSFLRNVNSRETGLSERTKMAQTQRDPNADETLKQYEAWLSAVDSSALFRARVLAMADDEQVCQLLLDAAATESVESGVGDIETMGPMDTLAGVGDPIEERCDKDAPRSMRKWATTYLAEEAAAFCRLPVLYDGEAIELPKETAASPESSGIVIGSDRNGHDVLVPYDLLPKHMFVSGVPGAGKTNTMLLLANSLWNGVVDGRRARVPFLVLEPAKREYRELALFDIPELVVFSPSASTNFPLRLNPFEFPVGLTLSEHIGRLCEVFEGAFPIAPPAPFILDRAIQAVYEARGWGVRDVNDGSREYPTLSELYDQFEVEMEKTNYDGEIRGNIRSVLEMRIGSLLRREKKDIFDAKRSSLTPEEWLERPVVVELEALGEGPANFVTLLLCTLIRETLKANPRKDLDKVIRHVIFLEEAHNLIAPESQVQDGMDSNPKVAATAYIVKMLAEVRALREGIIIADQLPTAMAPEVIKNTNVKLVHRLTSADDRELVGSTMSASTLQMENMATYVSGEALIAYEKLLRPFEMRVRLVEQHGTETPDDARLFELMLGKPGFVEIRRRDEDLRWEGIRRRAQALASQEKRAIDGLREFDLRKAEFADFERYVETCARILTGLERARTGLLFECKVAPHEYMDEGRYANLVEAIGEIGTRYRASLERFIDCY
ncbi:MAG: ATP-binding protein [Olsenella sp.]|nr:ATP-binding protein [Olsenella sp.]